MSSKETTTSSKSEKCFDATIVGGGVAGAATAINLAAAGWQVALLHQEDTRNGVESISPEGSRLLDALSIQIGEPLFEIASWWGNDREKRRQFSGARIVSRLDLAGKLRGRAADAGAIQFNLNKHLKLERLGDGWDIGFVDATGDSIRIRATHIVDASGRVSVVARKMGARRHVVDDLFCVMAFLQTPRIVGVWTEPVEKGWWNLCSLNDRGSLSFFGNRSEVEFVKHRFSDHFTRTRHLQKLLRPQVQQLSVWPCGSSNLSPNHGKGWIAVGDAAATEQPLASCGVARALQDAAMVREALKNKSSHDDVRRIEFDRYLELLSRQYATEQRWPNSSFWQPFMQTYKNVRTIHANY